MENTKQAFSAAKSTTPPVSRSGHSFLHSFTRSIGTQSSESETGPKASEVHYVLGGYNDEGPLDDVYRYNPDGDTWTKLCIQKCKVPKNAFPPLPRMDFDSCCINDKIYIFGGFQLEDEQVLILNDLWSLDVNKLCWKLIAEETPVSERAGHVVVSVGNDCFIVHGGEQMGRPFDDTWLYNTSTNQWKAVATSSNNKNNNNKNKDNKDNNKDTANAKYWNKPCARSAHSAAFCPESNALVIFGGITVEVPSQSSEPIHLNDLWILNIDFTEDPAKWTWRAVSLNSLAPSPRDLAGMVSIGDGILLINGGYGLKELESGGVDMIEEDEEEEEEGEGGEEEDDDNDDDNNDDDDEEGEEGVEGEVSLKRKGMNDSNEIKETDVDVEMNTAMDQTSQNVNDITNKMETISLKGGNASVAALPASKVTEDTSMEVDRHGAREMLSEDDDEAVEDGADADVQLEYLNDAWLVDLTTLSAIEIDLRDVLTDKSGKANVGPPRRGCKMIKCLSNNAILSFGGFDGRGFCAETEALDLTSLRTLSLKLKEA